jgi:drug/metabolite transporter (DMT)-like permease
VRRAPLTVGSTLALASAVTFGATTPLVRRFGGAVGPFATAAMLYGGAALISAVAALVLDRREITVRRADAGRIFAVTALGAVAAPVALAWGLQRTNGVTASLLLNVEAAFTVGLARFVWREPVGARVAVAAFAMTAGGAVLVSGAAGSGHGAHLDVGALAVVLATLAWAADNVIGRPLADRSVAQVVTIKGALGAALSACIARAAGETWPPWPAIAALSVCGALGYGASLHMYLRAQRLMGAARTGSVFAAAPFVGAGLAWAMGDRAASASVLWAAALCALGVWLHVTESHDHEHTHQPLEHDHVHRHGDGHHDHTHEGSAPKEHGHLHRHGLLTHGHPHGPDVHHGHDH